MSPKPKKTIRILSLADIKITDHDLTNTKFEILRKGAFYDARYGDFEITKDKMKSLKENFVNNVRGIDIAVDVNHDSFSGAVAWVDELFLEGSKLYMTLKDVTEEGKKILKEKIFKYFSVEFAPFDRVINGDVETIHDVLMGVALTNRPVIKGMSPTFMSEDATNRRSDMKPVKLYADSLIKKDNVSKDEKDLFKAMLSELPEEEQEELKDEVEKVEEKPEEKPAEEKPEKKKEEEEEKKPEGEEGEKAGDDDGKKDLAETNSKLAEANDKISKLEANEAERLTNDRTSEMTLSEKCKVGFPKAVSADLSKFIKSLSEAQYVGFKALMPKVTSVTDAMLKEMGDEGEVGAAKATEDKVVELAEKKMKDNPEMSVETAQKEAVAELGFDSTK